MTEAAIGYKQQVVAQAEGESQRFLSVLAEYQRAEGVTRTRLFLETLERVLRDSNKIILDESAGPGVLPYLPLDQLMRNRTTGGLRTPALGSGTDASSASPQDMEAAQ